MTKFIMSRPGAPWDYPTLNFTATVNGAILDGSLSTPVLTIPPDANWSVYGGGSAETGITRYPNRIPTQVTPAPEVTDGWLLAYNDSLNTATFQDPAALVAAASWSSALSAAYVGIGVNQFIVSGLTLGTTANTTIANANYTRIMAAVTAATVKGGLVILPAGYIYIGSHYLPFVDGVYYVGIQPGQKQTVTSAPNYAGNFHWAWTGTGTVLLGDGTSNAFWDGNTDQVSSPADLDATSRKMCGILGGIGIDGFACGVRSGAKNVMGLTFGTFGRIFIQNCSKAVHMVNFQELQWDYLESKARDGQYWGSDITPFTPGNSRGIGTLYHMLPTAAEATAGGFDLRDCRGIVFNAKQADGLNQMLPAGLQSTAYGVTELSVSGACVTGSANITVPDGTKFKVGFIVRTSADGFFNGTDNRAYVVKSVAGNVITLAYSLGQSAIAASGTGSVTFKTRGFASVEFVGETAGAGYITAFRAQQIDVEGDRVGIYAERILGGHLNVDQVPASTYTSLVARNCTMTVESTGDMTDNLDTNTANTSIFLGWRAGSEWNRGNGMYYDSVLGQTIARANNTVLT